ncbi:MAG: thiamine pyrophosphate-binding protein [Rhodospirillales bacterium]|jgi:acetolactate synthase-1/2/3 large subunit|nr:thiamine pyrophosphate-binding protein [Rhodospirillales bacterium]
MSKNSNSRTGGRILVDALGVHGVDTVFSVPGESYLAALDAFYDVRDSIRLISCRHESGAGFMAEAYGKLTGRPGVCFVTRGPGACNASIAAHAAFQDSTPMVLFIGQVARDQQDREAFQEMDFRRVFGEMSKWVAQIESPDRIPEYVSRAFHLAVSGRPGPVVLALPEDMLREESTVADTGHYKVVRAAPTPGQMQEMRAMLAAAKRPLMIVGGGGWSAEASRDIVAFAEANNLPTGASFRCQDLFDNNHRNYMGDVAIGINPVLADRIHGADLMVVVGARLGEMTTQGYSLPAPPRPRQTIVHVHGTSGELNRVYQADLPIASGMAQFAQAAAALEPVDAAAWSDWAKSARQDYEDWCKPDPVPGDLDMAEAVHILQERLGPDALIVTDGGNFSGWGHRFYRYTRYRSQIGPTCGAMGYGVPAAIGAKATAPDRPVVCFVGDGGFMMTAQEISTAMHYGIAPVILVINNNMYGTIRMHQERHYPGRTIATDLTNPDFAQFAQSFGAFGEVVEKTEEFAPALDRALDAGRIAVLDLRIDPEAITTRTTLTDIRIQALAGKGG